MVKVCEPCKERFRRLRLVQIGKQGQPCEVCEAAIGHSFGEHLIELGTDSTSPTLRWTPPAETSRPEPIELLNSQVRVGEVLDEIASPQPGGRWAPASVGKGGGVFPDGNDSTAHRPLIGAPSEPVPVASVPLGWRWEDDAEPLVSMRSVQEPPPPSERHKRKRRLRVAALGIVALALFLVVASRTDSPNQVSSSPDDKAASVMAAAAVAPAKTTKTTPKVARISGTPAAPAQQRPPPAPRPPPPPRPDRHGFPMQEAKRQLSSAAQRAARCARPHGFSGPTDVSVRFEPDGRTVPQVFLAPELEGTQEGMCIKRAMSGVRVRAFRGRPVTLSRRVHLHRR